MPLIRLDSVCLAYGLTPLLDHVDLQIEPGERVCLLGRNGTGKSSLLRLIQGEIVPDDGTIQRDSAVKVAALDQELPGTADISVFDAVAGGLADIGRLLADYHHAAMALAGGDDGALASMERLQHDLEARDGWRLHQRVETVLTRLELPADTRLGELSGGWRRRVMLGRALVAGPDLLLLDEPTNHLDIEAIQWLEEELLNYAGGLLFVTHDRAFLRRLATRIIELDRGNLGSWPGDYDRFLEKKAEALAAEARQQAEFDKKLAAEEVWIRKGIQARRTRNEGRVRALHSLRQERHARREQTGKASFEIGGASASGKLVCETENLGYRLDDGRWLVRDLDLRIMRGDRIGLIGPNGSGKTTLIRLLLKQLQSSTGTVRHGTRLEIAYFDQLRAALDPEATVLESVGEGRETVGEGDNRRHVLSYLQEFLFSPARARTPVKALSGGERNRLLLARLFVQPCNLLVLDEPTNDLDLETLELLEERLLDFQGTLLLVSHDREFLDRVVTSVMVVEEGGRWQEYVGGYSDWERQRPKSISAPAREPAAKPAALAPKSSSESRQRGGRLSNWEQRELAELPKRIEVLEAEQAKLAATTQAPDFYRCGQEEMSRVLARIQALDAELEAVYGRWEELESREG